MSTLILQTRGMVMHHKGLNPSLSKMESVFWIWTGPKSSGLTLALATLAVLAHPGYVGHFGHLALSKRPSQHCLEVTLLKVWAIGPRPAWLS